MTRILIIEDEESYREALAYMLHKEGFEVVEAADGSAGLAEYDRVGADLVLLDLMMPGLAGTEVFRQLRLRGPVPVIMVTARESEDRQGGRPGAWRGRLRHQAFQPS